MTRPSQNGRRPSGWIAAGSLLAAMGLGLALPVWILQRFSYWSHPAPFASDLLDAGIVPVFFLIIPWLMALGVYLVLGRLSARAARVWLGLVAGLGSASALMFGLVWAFGPRAWTTAATGFGLIIMIIMAVRHPRPTFGLLAWTGLGVAAAGAALTLWTWRDLARERTAGPDRDVSLFVIVLDEPGPDVRRETRGRIDARRFPHLTRPAPTRRLNVLKAWKGLNRTSPELKCPWSRGLVIHLWRWLATYVRFLLNRPGGRAGPSSGETRAAAPERGPPAYLTG